MRSTRQTVVVDGSVRTLLRLGAHQSTVFATLHRNDAVPHPELALRVAADLDRPPGCAVLLPWLGDVPAPLVALPLLTPREARTWLLDVD